jgi:ribonuclease HII
MSRKAQKGKFQSISRREPTPARPLFPLCCPGLVDFRTFPLGPADRLRFGAAMSAPDFQFETAAHARGLSRVAGIDEVGRGPLCGPVTAAAVILDPARIPPGLRDSKKLSPARREALADLILQTATVAIAHASVEEIDQMNILHASLLAMQRAAATLLAHHHLIDGNKIPLALQGRAECIVQGDARCLSIAAASIVAKVTRDRLMVDLAQQHPGYGWDRNAGYPTPEHLAALQKLGVTPAHRRSFAPVYKML